MENINNKNIIDEITRLTGEWYELIGNDHHKDKDCHWYITTKWSYGNNPLYIVEHNGYIYADIKFTCKTYEEALTKVKQLIRGAILDFKNTSNTKEEEYAF